MSSILGDREAFLCREVTKIHEELKRGTLSRLAEDLGARLEVLGEIVLVVKGAGTPEMKLGSMADALVLFDAEVQMGATPRHAAKEASLRTGLVAREIYAAAAGRRNGSSSRPTNR